MNRTFGRLARAALDPGVTTDAQLLADFVARRDDAAFAALVRRHGPMVLAVCRRVLRHQHDAEDAFQATFLVLARKAEDVWPREAVGAWLHGVAYRVAMKARGVRARQVRRERPLEDAPYLSPEPSPDLAEVLDRAIHKLPEAYRAAVVACDLEGRTRKDAADVLGWKEGTLSGRLARARQLLASRLRKMGLAVPVLTADAVPAALAESVVRAALGSSAAGVSAPVAALTEGVVRSMFLVKIKTLAATVLVAGVMGLGVWSAAGQGPGVGSGERPRVSGPSSTKPTTAPSDLDRLQGEWVIGRRYIENNPYLPKSVVESAVSAAKKDGTLILIEGPKMTWPLFDVAASGTTTTAAGRGGAATTNDDAGGPLLICPRHYTISIDPTPSPKHFDLTDQHGAVRKGIYKFEDGYFVLVLNEKGGRPKGFGDERVKDDEPMWTLWQPRPPQPKKAAAVPPAPRPELAGLELDVLLQELAALRKQQTPDPNALDRLHARVDAARSLLGRPTPPPKPAPPDDAQNERIEWARRMVKQGYMSQQQLEWEIRANDPHVKVLQGKWNIDWVWVNKGDAQSPLIPSGAQTSLTNKDDPRGSVTTRGSATPLEFSGNKLLMPYLDTSVGQKTVVYTFAVDSSQSPREIDLFAAGKPVGKGIYQFDGAGRLVLAVSLDGKRPGQVQRRGQDGVVTFELSRPAADGASTPAADSKAAEREYERAVSNYRTAVVHADDATTKAQAAAVELEHTKANLAAARAMMEQARQAADKPKAAPAKPSFTVHTRTPHAAETVASVPLTGNQTVVDVVATSVDVKLRQTASLWIVRGATLLPIDWVGITKHGVTTTNYQIQNGDMLFVQVNVGK